MRRSSRHTVIDDHGGGDFFIHCTDGDGKALVRTTHVMPQLERDGRYSSRAFEGESRIDYFLAEHGKTRTRSMRYREGVIEPGEVVAVVGVGQWERDPDEPVRSGDGYREAPTSPMRLLMEGSDEAPLLLSDEPKLAR